MNETAGVSHDLDSVRTELARLVVRDMKTPLAGLANLLEMADRASVKHFKDEASQYVNDALGATETLEEMVELLLGVRKLMSGEGAPDKHARDLFSLTRGVVAGLSEAAQAAGGSITVSGEPATVLCDTEQLSLLIRHVIRVALKAGIKAGGVGVHVARQDGQVHLSVECQPLSPGGCPKATDGLGLTYCRLVAEAHGGTFDMDSGVGKPCRWWCGLPVAEGLVAEAEAGPVKAAMEPSRRYLGRGLEAIGEGAKPGSIVSRGTRYQFGVAVALMSAIPLLAFAYLLGDAMWARSFDTETLFMMLPSVVALVALGVVLLARHTLEVAALRNTLERMAKGELPLAGLTNSSEDFLAIQRHLGAVIRKSDDKVRIIEAQAKARVQAEQQRVMEETVGAACHHLGQPATVIRVYLDLMKKAEMSPEMKGMIQECESAVDEVAEILQRLQGVGEYQTEPYLGYDQGNGHRADERILKI